MVGVYYYVNVSRPVGGTIRSTDGKINCGTVGGPNGTCGQARYLWTETATLTAIPDGTMYFQSWAGDCSGSVVDGCVLNTTPSGADKWVVAVFNAPGSLGHGSMASPSLHAPRFFDFLADVASAPRCNTCHGTNYSGQGIAPSCNACHAAAGWANWQQNCSFCHGLKNPTTMASDTFAAHPEWAAPPDDVNKRLNPALPAGVGVGAHQAHMTSSAIRGALACVDCHGDQVPTTAIHTLNRTLDLPFGPLARTGGSSPTFTLGNITCNSTYCHGATLLGGTPSLKNPTWVVSDSRYTACDACHGFPPPAPHPSATGCAGCHPDTIVAGTASTIDIAKGRHVNGTIEAVGGACDSCHGFPPASGAHLTHFGLTTAQGTSGYGDLSTLETRFPTASPTTAPASYAFGCGNCHPIDPVQHSMGSGSTTAKVRLYEAAAPAGSLKSLNATTATFDATAKTCSGVYCHSSGQEKTLTSNPEYVVTPAWTSTAKIACDGCHANPPKYVSGGPGTATANSHVQLDNESTPYPWGHFGIPMTNASHPQHGQGTIYDYWTGQTFFSDSAPMTCQTCHSGTTDPSNTGPGGFYYLDTTGNYTLPNGWGVSYACTSCHNGSNPAAPPGTGRVLPLRHVNGSRDVEFDARTGNPNAPWPPGTADDPLRPYWITQGSRSNTGWANTNVTFAGTTADWDLSPARYNPGDKTCTNVTCHMSQGNTAYTGTTPNDKFLPLRWGNTYYYSGTDPGTGIGTCSTCHRY
jgi:predicted CxxxxCH...CXXCH cytochrome family protein